MKKQARSQRNEAARDRLGKGGPRPQRAPQRAPRRVPQSGLHGAASARRYGEWQIFSRSEHTCEWRARSSLEDSDAPCGFEAKHNPRGPFATGTCSLWSHPKLWPPKSPP
mmetsp:Transcript_22797/g.71435  ORF Transcript_22797/g.71435 Transcript_22797/m.71435 type:complete len:110 (+) Transcript_22797:182-511(+)